MSGQEFSINLNLAVLPELDQRQNPDVYAELTRLRGAVRTLMGALDSYCGILGEQQIYWGQSTPNQWIKLQNLTRLYATASENIGAGAVVHLWDNAGALNIRNANASTSAKPARAYSPRAIGVGTVGEVILMGIVNINSLSIGTTYYLSNVDGIISNGPGTVSQKLGYAVATNLLFFNPAIG